MGTKATVLKEEEESRPLEAEPTLPAQLESRLNIGVPLEQCILAVVSGCIALAPSVSDGIEQAIYQGKQLKNRIEQEINGR